MKLENSAVIPAGIDKVWAFLDDTRSVAGCMPGAELTETIDRDNHRGQVKIRIGPLTMNYNGDVAVTARDESAHRLILDASGRDRRGSGTARASVELTLQESAGGTKMLVVTDLQLTGRVASLGRGVQDVSNKLFAEFAQNVAAQLAPTQAGAPQAGVSAQSAAPAAGASSSATPGQGGQPGEQAKTQLASAAAQTGGAAPSTGDDSIKVGSLVLTIMRHRIADLLASLSSKIRPKG